MRWKVLLMILCLFGFATAANYSEEDISKFFLRYVEALRVENYQVANTFWALYDQSMASQLKISYQDCPVKLEIGSLLWQSLPGMRSGELGLRVKDVEINRGFAKVTYLVIGQDTALGVHYVDVESNTDPYLVSPLQVFGGNWDRDRSTYFDMIYRDPGLIEPSNFQRADNFLKETAHYLGMSNEKLVILESLHARCYLCQSYGEIEQLKGSWPFDSFYEPADAIVSRYIPDRNQIVQFLVNYTNDNLPPQTLPLFKYGTATFIGGQNGRSRDVSLSLGKYIYQNSFTKLDDLMTVAGFNALESNPDFSYPVAAIFCKYLFEKLGRDDYFQLYREMSGSKPTVDSISVEACKAKVAKALGTDWPAVESDLNEFVNEIEYTDILPGASDEGELIFQSGYSGVLLKITEDDKYVNFVVNADSSMFSAAVLSGYPTRSSDYRSFLFEEHFPDTTYKQQHYGVIFTANEVGCYNYFTNEITGKYIVGLTSDQALSTDKKGEYRFRIVKELLPTFSKEAITLQPSH
jgi:hypothetical protein